MFRFFHNVVEAEAVAKHLENLGVSYVLTKHAIAERGAGEYSRVDYAYIEVAENYSHTLNCIAEEVDRLSLIDESENCGVPPLKDIGGRCF